mgnify:CR=1 FL=1
MRALRALFPAVVDACARLVGCVKLTSHWLATREVVAGSLQPRELVAHLGTVVTSGGRCGSADGCERRRGRRVSVRAARAALRRAAGGSCGGGAWTAPLCSAGLSREPP